ncbi:hypothetical protein GCM10009741_11080 [Kribbella lupini]|uniref:Uncharacterized protein n=1 Tax=Kribbella lupini TaxID=291602 RepID=A0ABN2AAE6_9ACTN
MPIRGSVATGGPPPRSSSRALADQQPRAPPILRLTPAAGALSSPVRRELRFSAAETGQRRDRWRRAMVMLGVDRAVVGGLGVFRLPVLWHLAAVLKSPPCGD